MPDSAATRSGDALSSMTGFASGQGAHEGWSWTVDIRSVNGRGLDIRMRLPDWIEGLEPDLRKLFQGRVQRGSINVGIRLQQEDASAGLHLNAEALAGTLSLLREIEHAAQSAGLRVDAVRATDDRVPPRDVAEPIDAEAVRVAVGAWLAGAESPEARTWTDWALGYRLLEPGGAVERAAHGDDRVGDRARSERHRQQAHHQRFAAKKERRHGEPVGRCGDRPDHHAAADQHQREHRYAGR